MSYGERKFCVVLYVSFSRLYFGGSDAARIVLTRRTSRTLTNVFHMALRRRYNGTSFYVPTNTSMVITKARIFRSVYVYVRQLKSILLLHLSIRLWDTVLRFHSLEQWLVSLPLKNPMCGPVRKPQSDKGLATGTVNLAQWWGTARCHWCATKSFTVFCVCV